MATYIELNQIDGSGESADLYQRILTALTIKAWAIIESASPTVPALAWARDCLANPSAYGSTALRAALADNAAAPKANILAADDAAVQTVVNNLVDKMLAV